MLKSTCNKGFHLTFTNGWTISVQWGAGNYCSNQNLSDNDWSNWRNRTADYKSTSAEIAIWRDGERGLEMDYIFSENNDKVMGYLTADEVAKWINKVSMW